MPTVDTLVAQHLHEDRCRRKTDGGRLHHQRYRPQIAQTIVHLGVDLSTVSTKATLADAFALALRRTDFSLVQPEALVTIRN